MFKSVVFFSHVKLGASDLVGRVQNPLISGDRILPVPFRRIPIIYEVPRRNPANEFADFRSNLLCRKRSDSVNMIRSFTIWSVAIRGQEIIEKHPLKLDLVSGWKSSNYYHRNVSESLRIDQFRSSAFAVSDNEDPTGIGNMRSSDDAGKPRKWLP